jgi:hypothetical protein
MRAANLSLRVGCFDDVDANRVDKRTSREGEGDWREDLAGGRKRKKNTEAYLSENGAVHGGWGGRRMRKENPEQLLGKLGTNSEKVERVSVPAT